MDKINYTEWFQSVGISTGDIIDVTSDLLSVMLYCRKRKIKFDVNELINALQETVGKNGTVMIRTFTWAFCRGEEFNICTTPSEVGSLGNMVMLREDFKRTQHPIYSWMVWGRHQELLCAMENTNSFGTGSIFDFLYQKGAKQLRIGNTTNMAFTQIHHAEALAKVPYRFEKTFEGKYTDFEGNSSIRCYTMFVRYLEFEVETIDPEAFRPVWQRNGVERLKSFDGLECGAVDLKSATDDLYNDLVDNGGKNVCIVNGEAGYM